MTHQRQRREVVVVAALALAVAGKQRNGFAKYECDAGGKTLARRKQTCSAQTLAVPQIYATTGAPARQEAMSGVVAEEHVHE